MVPPHCTACKNPLTASEVEFGRCDACGAKVPAADVEDDAPRPRLKRRTEQLAKTKEPETRESLLKQAKKQAATTLFVVAALMLVCNTVGVLMLGDQQGLEEEEKIIAVVVGVGVAVMFAGLGAWALFMPLPPTIIGLVLFTGLSVVEIVSDPAAIGRGIIIRIVIIVMLVKAINAAVKAGKLPAADREYEDDFDDRPRRPSRREYDDE